MSDLFGFEKAIQLDHLTDKQINELEEILKDYQQITACRFDRQNGHFYVMFITRLERLTMWNYWLVM